MQECQKCSISEGPPTKIKDVQFKDCHVRHKENVFILTLRKTPSTGKITNRHTVKHHVKTKPNRKLQTPSYSGRLESIWKWLHAIPFFTLVRWKQHEFFFYVLTMYSLRLRPCIPSWSLGQNFYSWIINPWK